MPPACSRVGRTHPVLASPTWADEPAARPSEMARHLVDAYPVTHHPPGVAGTAHVVGRRQPRRLDPGDEEASKQRRVGGRLNRRQGYEVDLTRVGEDPGPFQVRDAQTLGVGDEEAFREAGHVSPERTYVRNELAAKAGFSCSAQEEKRCHRSVVALLAPSKMMSYIVCRRRNLRLGDAEKKGKRHPNGGRPTSTARLFTSRNAHMTLPPAPE